MIQSLGYTTPAKSVRGSEAAPALAFVPIDNVPSAFTSVCDEIPPELCLDDYLAYFSSTWVQGFAAGRSARFPPACWTELHVT